MTKLNKNDFVEVEFDIFASGKLVQTTDEKKAKDMALDIKEFGPKTIVLGKGFILKALDEDILSGKTENTLELSPENAYGKRDKKMIKVFPKSAFDEHKMRAVVGITYDFNGMYGTVKSIAGGRVMVDFNNPLAGKEIKLIYKLKNKIEDIKTKLDFVLAKVINLPKDSFEIVVKEKNITLKMPEALTKDEKMLITGLEEFVGSLKDFTLKIETFKKQ